MSHFLLTVKLTAEQELRAAMVGYRRRENALRRALQGRHYAHSQWEGSCEGACAELVGHLATGLPWTGEEVFGEPPFHDIPDLGEKTEVHWVSPDRRPVLRVDVDKDHRERDFILVIGFAPVYVVHGLMRCEEVVRRGVIVKYEERTCAEVPASWLYDLSTGQEMRVVAR